MFNLVLREEMEGWVLSLYVWKAEMFELWPHALLKNKLQVIKSFLSRFCFVFAASVPVIFLAGLIIEVIGLVA